MGPIATGVYGITSAAWLSRGPRGAAVGERYSIPVTHTSDHTSVKPGSSSACSGFAPATKVWALGGRKPIGEIKVGDRVLAQDVETGELAYKPVLAVPIRPLGPRETRRVPRVDHRGLQPPLLVAGGRLAIGQGPGSPRPRSHPIGRRAT